MIKVYDNFIFVFNYLHDKTVLFLILMPFSVIPAHSK